jgi:ATP-dependent Clp protease, protease subunit
MILDRPLGTWPQPGRPDPEPPERPFPFGPPEFPGPTPPSRLPVGQPTVTPYPDGASWWEERLFEQRVVLATGRLDRERATALAAKVLTLDALGREKITLRLDSEGADLDGVWSLVDTLDLLTAPVHLLVVGEAGGGSLALLTAVAERRAHPHARFRLAEPRLPGIAGTAERVAGEFAAHRALLDAFTERLARTTGRQVDQVAEDLRRGRFLTAEQAVGYGLVSALTG